MNPIVTRLLDKARKLLVNASIALSVGLNDDAGRNAYLSGYNAARAFLYQQEGKLFKTHNGLQAEFSRVVKDDPRFNPETRVFLSKTFNLKKIADYEEGPEGGITSERASIAIKNGKKFLSCCEDAIATPRNGRHKKPSATP